MTRTLNPMARVARSRRGIARVLGDQLRERRRLVLLEEVLGS